MQSWTPKLTPNDDFQNSTKTMINNGEHLEFEEIPACPCRFRWVFLSTSFVEFFSKSEHSNRASMHRSDAIHLNFILCKYYDFITADLKVYSDRKTQRNQVRKTQRNRAFRWVFKSWNDGKSLLLSIILEVENLKTPAGFLTFVTVYSLIHHLRGRKSKNPTGVFNFRDFL